jgi:hypothetical protein
LSSGFEKKGLPFLRGKPFLNTKDTTPASDAGAGEITKENARQMSLLSPFVYVVSLVFRLFPAQYGRAKKWNEERKYALFAGAYFVIRIWRKPTGSSSKTQC